MISVIYALGALCWFGASLLYASVREDLLCWACLVPALRLFIAATQGV